MAARRRDEVTWNSQLKSHYFCINTFLRFIKMIYSLPIFLSHINSVKRFCSPWVLVAQWLERPPCVWEVMGSIPVGDSDIFLCPIFALIFAPILCCSEREARQLWQHKIQFRQFFEVCTNYSICKAKKNRSNISAAFWLNYTKIWIMIIWIRIFYLT